MKDQIKIQVSDDGLFGTPVNEYEQLSKDQLLNLPPTKFKEAMSDDLHPRLPLTTPQIPKSVVMGEVVWYERELPFKYWVEIKESEINDYDLMFHEVKRFYKIITPVPNSEPVEQISKEDYEKLLVSEKALYSHQWQEWKSGWVNCSEKQHEVVGHYRFIYILKSSNSEPKEDFAIKKQKEGVFYSIIGGNIIKGRNNKNITQEQLGSRLGISRVSVGNIESGKQRLPVHLMHQVANALNIDLMDLFNGLDRKFSKKPLSKQTINSTKRQTSHDKALEILRHKFDETEYETVLPVSTDSELLEGYKSEYEAMIEIANWQAQQQPVSKSEWISVEDRLPKEGQIVDIWNGNNLRSEFTRNQFERYVDICNKDRVMTLIYMKVTHWKPLSQPPVSL